MRRLLTAATVLQFCVLSLVAAEAPKECTLCVGATADVAAPPAVVIPLILQVKETDLATLAIDALSQEQRAKLTVTVSYEIES